MLLDAICCPACRGTGKLLVTKPIEDLVEWELEKEFRLLELKHLAKPYEKALICQGCGLPYLVYETSTSTFCGADCQRAYYKRGHKPLLAELSV